LAKILAFFTPPTASFAEKVIITMDFGKIANFFDENWQK
jgi:hypothetical protein